MSRSFAALLLLALATAPCAQDAAVPPLDPASAKPASERTVEVVKDFYPDSADQSGKLGMVDVKPLMPVAVKVGLPAMRANPELSKLSLLRQSRLSVCPVSEREWIAICGMAGIRA